MDQPYAARAGRLSVPFVAPFPQYQLFQFVHTDTERILLPILCDLWDLHVPLGQVPEIKVD